MKPFAQSLQVLQASISGICEACTCISFMFQIGGCSHSLSSNYSLFNSYLPHHALAHVFSQLKYHILEVVVMCELLQMISMVFNNNIAMHINNFYFLFLALLIFFLQARFFFKLSLLQSIFHWVVHTFFLDHSWSCFGNHKCWLYFVIHFLPPSCSRSHFGSHPNWFLLVTHNFISTIT